MAQVNGDRQLLMLVVVTIANRVKSQQNQISNIKRNLSLDIKHFSIDINAGTTINPIVLKPFDAITFINQSERYEGS